VGTSTFTIPAGVTSLTIDVLGGGGDGGITQPSGAGATGGSATFTYGSLSTSASGGNGGGNSDSSSKVGVGGTGGQTTCTRSLCSSLARTAGTAGQPGGWYPPPEDMWGMGGAGGAPNGANGIDPVGSDVGGPGGGGGGGEVTGTIAVTPGSTVTIVIGPASSLKGSVTLTW
jgi:hypothetical protein